MSGRVLQHLSVFLYWYVTTFLSVCGFASLFALRLQAFWWWGESAIATFLVTLAPATLTWIIVGEGASRINLSARTNIFWSGTAATAVSLLVMSIGEDASYSPRWMSVSLFPALAIGGLPLMVVGPAIAYWLGKRRA